MGLLSLLLPAHRLAEQKVPLLEAEDARELKGGQCVLKEPAR